MINRFSDGSKVNACDVGSVACCGGSLVDVNDPLDRKNRTCIPWCDITRERRNPRSDIAKISADSSGSQRDTAQMSMSKRYRGVIPSLKGSPKLSGIVDLRQLPDFKPITKFRVKCAVNQANRVFTEYGQTKFTQVSGINLTE
jgi:hypothetical protein